MSECSPCSSRSVFRSAQVPRPYRDRYGRGAGSLEVVFVIGHPRHDRSHRVWSREVVSYPRSSCAVAMEAQADGLNA